jgi:hypothetical protein
MEKEENVHINENTQIIKVIRERRKRRIVR